MPSWDAMRLHFPQECSQVKNNSDVQNVFNSFNRLSDILEAGEETFTNDSGSKIGHSSECKVIHNNCGYKEINSKDAKISTQKILPTKCFKIPVCYVCKKNKAESYTFTQPDLYPTSMRKSTARKGTRYSSVLNGNPVFNYTIQYVTRKNHCLDFAGSFEGDNRNHVTTGPNAESALENASNESMSTDYDINAILKEYKLNSPISNFDDSSVLSVDLDFPDNNPGHESNCSITSPDVETEVQKAADIYSCDKENVKFSFDDRGHIHRVSDLKRQ
jgi:hypothetical protein